MKSDHHLTTYAVAPFLLVLAGMLSSLAQAQLTAPVVLPGDLIGGAAAGVEVNPTIVRGGNQYLVVWEDSRAQLSGEVGTGGHGPFKTDIYAVRLDADGKLLDTTAIQVSSAPFIQAKVRAGWNGSAWLVVWEVRRPTQYSTTLGIRAARVSPAGQVLDMPPIVIDDRDDVDERFPAVAGDGTNWAVLWRDLNGDKTKLAVSAAVVGPSGNVLSKQLLFTDSNGSLIPLNLNIAHAGGTYLMTSDHDKAGGGGGVFGQFLDPSLNKIGSEFFIGNGGDRSFLTSNGSGFYVTWNAVFGGVTTLVGSPVTATGTVTVPGGTPVWSYGQSKDTSPRAGWTGAGWLLTFQGWNGPGGGFTAYAADIDQAGALLGAPYVVNNAGHATESVAAGGAGTPGETVVAWLDSRDVIGDVYGTVVTTGGIVGPESPLSLSAPTQTRPDLAGDAANGFLVVFESRVDSQNRILAQRVDGQGQPIDAQPIELASGGQTLWNPAVAWDGQRWLVVWEEWPGESFMTTAMVRGRRVRPDGTLLDPAPFDILVGNQPSVSALNEVFLVAVSREPKDDVRSIRGARVDGPSAAVLDAASLFLGGNYARFPAAATLGDRWLVAWQRNATHDNPIAEIRATFVTAQGSVVGEFTVEDATGNTHFPSIGVVGMEAMIGFSDSSDARARRIASDGTLLGSPTGFLISSAPNNQYGVEIAGDGSLFVAAWRDLRIHSLLEAGLGDVYASRIEADETVLDPGGLAVANDFFQPEGNVAVAGDGGKVLIAYADLLPQAPYSTYRIVVRTVGSEPVGTAYCGPANLNSAGFSAVISGVGSPVAAANDLTLTARQLPPGKVGYFLASQTQAFVPFPPGSQGNLCLGGTIARFAGQIQSSGSAGEISIPVDLTSIPTTPPHTVVAGETWNFQLWYRDKNPTSTSNFSDGLSISYQ